jgi:hypothetical protein
MPIAVALGGSRVASQLDAARHIAEGAIPAGFIPNQDFERFKRALATALEESHDGWQKKYLEWHRKQTVTTSATQALSELYYLQPQVNNIPGYVTKATKALAVSNVAISPNARALVEELLALFREFVPWHGIYVQLKGKVAKRGDARLTPAAPREVNPDQIRATCSCCFRQIAIASGGTRMAHHGYQRPQLGWQTASCMGVAYPPFESSADGTRAYRQAILNHAMQMRKMAADVAESTRAINVERSYAGRQMADLVVEPGDPNYEAHKRNKIAQLTQRAKINEQAAAQLDTKIASWVHVAIAGLRNA